MTNERGSVSMLIILIGENRFKDKKVSLKKGVLCCCIY